jgi:hypothetical protein
VCIFCSPCCCGPPERHPSPSGVPLLAILELSSFLATRWLLVFLFITSNYREILSPPALTCVVSVVSVVCVVCVVSVYCH